MIREWIVKNLRGRIFTKEECDEIKAILNYGKR